MVEAQIEGHSSEISKVEKEQKEWSRSLSSDDRSEMEEYYKNSLTEHFMKAFDEQLSEIGDKINSHSYSSIDRAYEKFSKKTKKIDEKYRRFANASLSLYLSKTFAKELEGYADAVLNAIKKGEKSDVQRGDKDFVRMCEKISGESSEVSNAFKKAYEDVLKKKFEEYVKDNMKEYESLCKKGDKEGAEKWLKEYNKQIDKLLSNASDEVKTAFGIVNQNIAQEAMKQIEE